MIERLLLFIFATAAANALCPPRRRPLLLVAASYAFYLWADAKGAALLLAATAAAHAAGKAAGAGDERRREAGLWSGVIVLLGTLAFFKYAALPLGWALAAPLGISYYTFKLISYVIDVSWGKSEPARDFVSLAAYASFFPQILSGPIQRAESFLPQLESGPTAGGAAVGLRRVAFGLFQKVVVADRLAAVASEVFDHPGRYHGPQLLLGLCCFSLQLYADFSGITDIALGAGLLLGIRGPENFNYPWSAPNIQEFWRRWHITLSSWLTDYVFVPLSFSLRAYGLWGVSISVFVTMCAIGAWHGPRWNFLIFGAVHGVYIVVSLLTLKRRDKLFSRHPVLAELRRAAGPALLFLLVTFSFVFFRSPTPAVALSLMRDLFRGGPWAPGLASYLTPFDLWLLAGAIVTLGLVHRAQARSAGWLDAGAPGPGAPSLALFYAAVGYFLLLGPIGAVQQFIYLRF